jgi:hypothetical protein
MSVTDEEARAHFIRSIEDVTDPEIAAHMRAVVERDDRIAAKTPPTLPACPSWCRHLEFYGKHDYDSVSEDERTFSRFHVDGGPSDSSTVHLEEFNTDGVVTFGPLFIAISEEDGSSEMNAAQVRERAAEMVAAAERLEAIERQG